MKHDNQQLFMLLYIMITIAIKIIIVYRCVNYVHYYPRTELELCKSSVSEPALRSYFQYLQVRRGDRWWCWLSIANIYVELFASYVALNGFMLHSTKTSEQPKFHWNISAIPPLILQAEEGQPLHMDSNVSELYREVAVIVTLNPFTSWSALPSSSSGRCTGLLEEVTSWRCSIWRPR